MNIDDMDIKRTDVVIVGMGAAGLFCALHFPEEINVLLLCKTEIDESDSYLAQGGICMLRGEEDYDSYFEDTMRAGHYENNRDSVDIMIRSSQEIIEELMKYGVEFEKDGEDLCFTREGGHSKPRILFHEDCTGREITSTLLRNVKMRKNISILDHTMMLDLLTARTDAGESICQGIVARASSGEIFGIQAKCTVLACGGLGGIYEHSTNFRHITGDALAIAKEHGVKLEHVSYIQIHPTTLYSKKSGRRFLISESVRGEGAILLDKDKKRFCDELQPRDVVTAAIRKQMKKDGTPYVWLSMEKISEEEIRSHFPNILEQCLMEGYDPTKECIPVVPAQHYFMGGIKVDLSSKTSMDRLYAVGETSCNGVHGKNRLASNSLLESMVFAERAAKEITEHLPEMGEPESMPAVDIKKYKDINRLKIKYQKIILEEIEKERKDFSQKTCDRSCGDPLKNCAENKEEIYE